MEINFYHVKHSGEQEEEKHCNNLLRLPQLVYDTSKKTQDCFKIIISDPKKLNQKPLDVAITLKQTTTTAFLLQIELESGLVNCIPNKDSLDSVTYHFSLDKSFTFKVLQLNGTTSLQCASLSVKTSFEIYSFILKSQILAVTETITILPLNPQTFLSKRSRGDDDTESTENESNFQDQPQKKHGNELAIQIDKGICSISCYPDLSIHSTIAHPSTSLFSPEVTENRRIKHFDCWINTPISSGSNLNEISLTAFELKFKLIGFPTKTVSSQTFFDIDAQGFESKFFLSMINQSSRLTLRHVHLIRNYFNLSGKKVTKYFSIGRSSYKLYHINSNLLELSLHQDRLVRIFLLRQLRDITDEAFRNLFRQINSSNSISIIMKDCKDNEIVIDFNFSREFNTVLYKCMPPIWEKEIIAILNSCNNMDCKSISLIKEYFTTFEINFGEFAGSKSRKWATGRFTPTSNNEFFLRLNIIDKLRIRDSSFRSYLNDVYRFFVEGFARDSKSITESFDLDKIENNLIPHPNAVNEIKLPTKIIEGDFVLSKTKKNEVIFNNFYFKTLILSSELYSEISKGVFDFDRQLIYKKIALGLICSHYYLNIKNILFICDYLEFSEKQFLNYFNLKINFIDENDRIDPLLRWYIDLNIRLLLLSSPRLGVSDQEFRYYFQKISLLKLPKCVRTNISLSINLDHSIKEDNYSSFDRLFLKDNKFIVSLIYDNFYLDCKILKLLDIYFKLIGWEFVGLEFKEIIKSSINLSELPNVVGIYIKLYMQNRLLDSDKEFRNSYKHLVNSQSTSLKNISDLEYSNLKKNLFIEIIKNHKLVTKNLIILFCDFFNLTLNDFANYLNLNVQFIDEIGQMDGISSDSLFRRIIDFNIRLLMCHKLELSHEEFRGYFQKMYASLFLSPIKTQSHLTLDFDQRATEIDSLHSNYLYLKNDSFVHTILNKSTIIEKSDFNNLIDYFYLQNWVFFTDNINKFILSVFNINRSHDRLLDGFIRLYIKNKFASSNEEFRIFYNQLIERKFEDNSFEKSIFIDDFYSYEEENVLYDFRIGDALMDENQFESRKDELDRDDIDSFEAFDDRDGIDSFEEFDLMFLGQESQSNSQTLTIQSNSTIPYLSQDVESIISDEFFISSELPMNDLEHLNQISTGFDQPIDNMNLIDNPPFSHLKQMKLLLIQPSLLTYSQLKNINKFFKTSREQLAYFIGLISVEELKGKWYKRYNYYQIDRLVRLFAWNQTNFDSKEKRYYFRYINHSKFECKPEDIPIDDPVVSIISSCFDVNDDVRIFEIATKNSKLTTNDLIELQGYFIQRHLVFLPIFSSEIIEDLIIEKKRLSPFVEGYIRLSVLDRFSITDDSFKMFCDQFFVKYSTFDKESLMKRLLEPRKLGYLERKLARNNLNITGQTKEILRIFRRVSSNAADRLIRLIFFYEIKKGDDDFSKNFRGFFKQIISVSSSSKHATINEFNLEMSASDDAMQLEKDPNDCIVDGYFANSEPLESQIEKIWVMLGSGYELKAIDLNFISDFYNKQGVDPFAIFKSGSVSKWKAGSLSIDPFSAAYLRLYIFHISSFTDEEFLERFIGIINDLSPAIKRKNNVNENRQSD